MTKDIRLKGLYAAQRNKVTARRPKTDPRSIDNRTCLIPSCTTPVYWYGEVYWSLCLSCLEQKQLGPFRQRVAHVTDSDWPDRGECSGSLVANALIRKESK